MTILRVLKKTKPALEGTPAATTEKTLKSTYDVGKIPDPKKGIIEQQQKTTKETIEASKRAKPIDEGRPAVSTNKTLKPVESGK